MISSARRRQLIMTANALHGIALEWTGDGKAGATFVADGTDLTVDPGKRGTPFNVRVSNAPSSEYYFGVRLEQMAGSFSLGVVTPDEFKGGWRTKGMFYNGNLTNGSGALATSWGPYLKVGDSVGVRVIRAGNTLESVYYLNGASLGTGFSLENVPADKPYHPCINMDGPTKLSLEIPAQLPAKKPTTGTAASDIFGAWRLKSAVKEDGSPLVVTVDRPITLELARASPTSLAFHFKVANPMNGGATVVSENGNSFAIQMGGLMSGRMMAPPEYRHVESFLSQLNANQVSLTSSGQLVLSNGSSASVTWTRNPRNPQPMTSYR